jgi:hypothetical protein
MGVQSGTDRGEAGNSDNRDERGNETVFDCRGARPVAEKLLEELARSPAPGSDAEQSGIFEIPLNNGWMLDNWNFLESSGAAMKGSSARRLAGYANTICWHAGQRTAM